jgi:hypothetical protein
MVIDSDIRQRNALFDLSSLTDIRRLQIALCKSDLAEPDDGETKSEWLKRDCIHIVAVTLPRFSILRYQIIHRPSKPWIVIPSEVEESLDDFSGVADARISRDVSTSLDMTSRQACAGASRRRTS